MKNLQLPQQPLFRHIAPSVLAAKPPFNASADILFENSQLNGSKFLSGLLLQPKLLINHSALPDTTGLSKKKAARD